MEKDREKNLRIINFLKDTDFIIYVLEKNILQDLFGQKLIADDREIHSAFYKAFNLLKNLDHPSNDFSLREIEALRKRIENSLKKG